MTVDVSGLVALVEEYAAEVGAVVRDELESTVKDAAPVGETGRTRDEITVDVSVGGSSVSWTVDSPAEQSSFTDEGTDPHDIYGKPWLAWDGPGGTVILNAAKTPVHHPGNAAQNWFSVPMPQYFQDALDIAAAEVSVS